MRYSYSPECGGFTVKVGRAEGRMCKVLDAPNCVGLYGNEHEFI